MAPQRPFETCWPAVGSVTNVRPRSSNPGALLRWSNLKKRSKKKVIDVLQDAPETVILAEDEASLYLQTTRMPVWALTGQTPRVWSDPNRKKVCFYGILNLLNGRVTVTRTETMNSPTIAQHLEAVLASYPDNSLLLLWDGPAGMAGRPFKKSWLLTRDWKS